MQVAGLYIRVLVAWLLAMQPILGAYATAEAANAPLAAELCRGGLVPETGSSLPAADHGCCLAACTLGAVPLPHQASVPAPRLVLTTARGPAAEPETSLPPGRGLNSARAPPA